MRSTLLRLAIFLPASFYLVEFLLSGTPYGSDRPIAIVSNVVSVVAAFSVGLGLVNVFGIHAATVARRSSRWGYSLVVFLSFLATAALCLHGARADAAMRKHEASFARRLAGAQQIADPAQRASAVAAVEADRNAFLHAYRFNGRSFYVSYVNKPLVGSAMALLGFYVTYAGYRAFRLHSRDAAIMMASALIVLLGRDAIGAWVTWPLETSPNPWLSWISLPRAAEFVVNVVSAAFQRGIQIGLHVAVMAVSLRIMLGQERGLVDPPAAEPPR